MRVPHILCTIARPAGARGGSAAAMTRLTKEYAARAATFRRLAGELKNADDRAALLAIAAEYEEEAERRAPRGRS